MTAFTLKTYQQSALTALALFLRQAGALGLAAAGVTFKQIPYDVRAR